MNCGDKLASSKGPGRFERTVWTDVLKAAGDSQDATQAFDRLAKAYWRPVYDFVLHRVRQTADAEDITQSFFEFLIVKKPLRLIDPAKGRFRAFLLGVLRNFLSNWRASQNAQKRGGGQASVSLDDLPPNAEADAGITINCSPDEAFDADWAGTLLRRATTQLKAEYETAGRASWFEKLKSHLSLHDGAIPYAVIGRDLGMTEDAVKMAVHRLRRRFRKILLARIAETVSNPEDVMDEYRYLVRILTRGPT